MRDNGIFAKPDDYVLERSTEDWDLVNLARTGHLLSCYACEPDVLALAL